tara:strand:+ start:229 stop:462 length:234 start_codon:yes stop_codon:yes gene_type:complete
MIYQTSNPLLPSVIEEDSNQSSETIIQSHDSNYVNLNSVEEVRMGNEKKIRYCMYILSGFLLFSVIYIIFYYYLIKK